MNSKFKMFFTVILFIGLTGCTNVSEKIDEFENNIDNMNYELAYITYNENSDNKKFITMSDEILEEKLNIIKKNISEETMRTDKEFIEFFIRVKGDNEIEDILNEIQGLENRLEELSSGVNHLENKEYYLAICEFINIEEGSEAFDEAQEYISNNINDARNEKIVSAQKKYYNKQYDLAIKELEDIKKIVDNDKEIEELIKQYTSDKVEHEKEIENKKEQQLEEEKKQEESKQEEVKQEETTQNLGYNNYYNTRYKFSIDYPDFLIEQPAPTNNDGRVFKNSSGTVSLVVSGYNNVLYETAESGYNEALSTLNGVEYKNLSERSYVISWQENNEIVYLCKVFGQGSINSFSIRYPKNEANAYSKIVERLYNSFTPGNLDYAY